MAKLRSQIFHLLLFSFLLGPLHHYAQTPTKTNSEQIAEMLVLRKNAKTEKEKLRVFVELAWMYRNVNTTLAQAYSDSTILIAKKQNNYKSYWLGLNSKAEALRLSGNLEEAFKTHQLALQIAEKNKLTQKSAHSLNNIGLILKRQNNFDGAKEYISKAREVYKSINDTDGIITTSTNLGNCIKKVKDYDKAINYYNEVITLAEPRNDFESLGDAYTNIAHSYYYMNLKTKAKEYYYKGLLYREKMGIPSPLADSYYNYGYMFFEEGDFKTANEYCQKALILTRPTGDKDNLIDLFSFMSEMALAKKDFKTAYYYADSTRIYRDSVINETNVQSLNEMSQRFDSEKKQIQIESLGKENELKESENKQQKFILIIVGLALIISISLGISVFKQYKQKNKANQIIHKQKEILEEKQKEIFDSITYAKRLQEAILPTEHSVKEYFPESFILYKPKDIVAGDFYWLEHQKDLVFLAAADCTGHGVPGALVSVVCSNALHRTVNEFGITDPGKILDKTRELVLETFARSNKDVKDGMDISLCCINSNTNQLTWSGANNPLWYIQTGELKEITANKQPIGKIEDPQPFLTHIVQLQKGDSIYLFTDGYADQFGGPKGKKFKYKAFKSLLLQNSNLPLNQQQQELDMALAQWQGHLEQVDDVCVIGIRI